MLPACLPAAGPSQGRALDRFDVAPVQAVHVSVPLGAWAWGRTDRNILSHQLLLFPSSLPPLGLVDGATGGDENLIFSQTAALASVVPQLKEGELSYSKRRAGCRSLAVSRVAL